MEKHLILTKGNNHYLLLRSDSQIHILTVDRRMNEQTEEWLLAQPRSVAAMNERQLSRNSIDVTRIRKISAEGTGAGCVVEIFQQQGKLRYMLSDDTTQEDMDILFRDIPCIKPWKPDNLPKDWRTRQQNPELRKKTKVWGTAVNVVGVVSGILTMSLGYMTPWLCWINLLCIVAGVALYCLFPAYYTMIEPPKGSRSPKRAHLILYSISVPALGLIVACLTYGKILSWWRVFAVCGILAAVITWLLCKSSPELQTSGMVLVTGLICLVLSIGPVTAVNLLMDFGPEQLIRTEVVDKDISSGSKSGDTYILYVMLEGEKTGIRVWGSLYRQLEVGDTARVVIRQGACGIPYAIITESE